MKASNGQSLWERRSLSSCRKCESDFIITSERNERHSCELLKQRRHKEKYFGHQNERHHNHHHHHRHHHHHHQRDFGSTTIITTTTISTRLARVNRNPKRHKASATEITSSSSSSSSSMSSSCGRGAFMIISKKLPALLALLFVCTMICWCQQLTNATISSGGKRMVRLCIASVDPIKLSSQCVMCNRREFPLTVIDCTGITKVNDLIANPLSVQEATCLIYNCRRQVPDVKPELYHGSVSSAVNYRGGVAASNYHSPAGPMMGQTSGSSIYEMMTPSSMLGGGYSTQPTMLSGQEQQLQSPYLAPSSPYMTRYGLGYNGGANPYQTSPASSILSPLASLVPRGLIGGPSLLPNRQQALPYALVPAPGFAFGSRKYKAALVPLF